MAPQCSTGPRGLHRAQVREVDLPRFSGHAASEEVDDAGKNGVSYAVYRHVTAGATGATWYFYEKVPLSSAAPHDPNGVVAYGLGSSGPAQTICVSCHQAAGSDANHSGHDFVYTQVK